MKAWMIYTKSDYKLNKQYYKMHVEKGMQYKIDIQLIIVEYLSFGVKNNEYFLLYNNEPLDSPDFVIMRSRYSLLSRQLELMGIRVYNNSYVCDICNDKSKTYQLLASKGIDIIDSQFILNTSFYNSDDKLNILKNNYFSHSYNTLKNVIKSVDGHGGKEVYLIDDFLKSHNRLSNDMVIQPLVKGKSKDIRVYVLNNEIIASVLRTSNDGFKSNYSLGGNVSNYILKDNECDIVYKIIDIFKKALDFWQHLC